MLVLVFALFAACATTEGPEKSKVSEGYYNKGLSYLQANDLANAMAEFHRSVQTDPKNKMAYYALGLVYMRQDKMQDGEKYLKEAISIDDQFSDAYNALGILYSKQEKWKEALKAFNRALDNKLYPTPHMTYINIGDMYMAQRDFARAAEAYRESKRIANLDVTILRLGRALLEAGRLKDAITELREGVSLAPKNPDMHLALGQAYLKNGDKRAALAEFRMAAELAPKTDISRTAQDYIAAIEKTQRN
jgi:type IV pilus assembly protein PilF